MNQEMLIKNKDRKVRLFLNNGRIYTGTIFAVSNQCIELIDKFGNDVTLMNEMIVQIETMKDDGDKNGLRF